MQKCSPTLRFLERVQKQLYSLHGILLTRPLGEIMGAI